MKRGITLGLAALLLCGVLHAQDDNFLITVLAYQWTTSHNTLTFTYAGHADTSCNGNTDVNGYVSSGGNVYASGTSSSNCSTTYTPPSTQNIDIQTPVVYILADSDSSRMILTCTRNMRWSQCEALNPGVFMARMNKGHFEVEGMIGKGKEKWVKFNVVQQTAIIRQQPQTAAAQVAPASIEAPASDTSSANSGGFPSRWTSMTNGSIRTVRFDGDYIYAEVVVSDAAARAGVFVLTNAKKEGDQYVGKINTRILKTAAGPSCTLTLPVEFTLVTPDRIEGRYFASSPNSKIDWDTCSYSNPAEWVSFVWIPIK